MLFALNTQADGTVLRIEGELDALSVVELRPLISQLGQDSPKQMVVDLSGLRLIDSSGVGAIVSLFKQVRANGGSLVLEGVHGQPLAILRLLRLDRVLIRDAGR